MRVQLFVAVVDAFEQRPLVLDRICVARAYCSPSSTSSAGSMRGARGSSCARNGAFVECSDSASAGFTRRARQPFEYAPVADRGEDQVLVPDRAFGAQQFDRLEHVVQVVRRLAHAHEHDFADGAQPRASTTCATISALPRWRLRPSRPVMQKTQPTAQPTWVETQTASRGSSTHSTVWPSASSTSSRPEPSSPACSHARAPSSSAPLRSRAAQCAVAREKILGSRRPLPSGSAWVHAGAGLVRGRVWRRGRAGAGGCVRSAWQPNATPRGVGPTPLRCVSASILPAILPIALATASRVDGAHPGSRAATRDPVPRRSISGNFLERLFLARKRTAKAKYQVEIAAQ